MQYNVHGALSERQADTNQTGQTGLTEWRVAKTEGSMKTSQTEAGRQVERAAPGDCWCSGASNDADDKAREARSSKGKKMGSGSNM